MKHRPKQDWPSFVFVQRSQSLVTSTGRTFRKPLMEVLNPEDSNIGLRSFRMAQVLKYEL